MRRIARIPRPVQADTAAVRSASAPRHHYHHCAALYSQPPRHATQPTQRSSQHTPSPLCRPRTYRPLVCSSRLLSTSAARRQATPTDTKVQHLQEQEQEQENLEAATSAAEAEADADAQQLASFEDELPQSDAVLVVPGSWETAPRPGEIADSTYVPAASGEGLEEVGGLQGWWEDNRHWDESVELRGFGPRRPVTDPDVLQVLARRAVFEAIAIQQTGDQGLSTTAWRRGGAREQDAALSLQVVVAADGSVSSVRGDVASVVEGLAPVDGDEESPVLEAEEARALIASWAEDASWKNISLGDPIFKFAINKRILQLTGQLLPDSQLANAHTVGGLLSVLVRPPKPKKLAEELAADGTLAGLPNVAVYGRRVTPIDKHKMVGRWKVIVEELEKRNLPVTGTGNHGKAVEWKWSFY